MPPPALSRSGRFLSAAGVQMEERDEQPRASGPKEAAVYLAWYLALPGRVGHCYRLANAQRLGPTYIHTYAVTPHCPARAVGSLQRPAPPLCNTAHRTPHARTRANAHASTHTPCAGRAGRAMQNQTASPEPRHVLDLALLGLLLVGQHGRGGAHTARGAGSAARRTRTARTRWHAAGRSRRLLLQRRCSYLGRLRRGMERHGPARKAHRRRSRALWVVHTHKRTRRRRQSASHAASAGRNTGAAWRGSLACVTTQPGQATRICPVPAPPMALVLPPITQVHSSSSSSGSPAP